MDWANERYVRVYTRDTVDWLCLSWEARALWLMVIRKLDRSGLIETSKGARGVAAMIGMPVEVVESALAELLADGCLRESTGAPGYVAPNYIEAQETPQSDKQRARVSRERRRDGSVTKRDGEVTNRDDSVTSCHAGSHDVTLSQSEPSQTRSQSVDLRSTPASPAQLSLTPEHAAAQGAQGAQGAQDAADAPTLGAGTPVTETCGTREPGAPGEVSRVVGSTPASPAQLSLTELAGPVPPKPLRLPKGVALAAAGDFAAAMVGELNRLTGMAYRADGRDAVQRAGVLVSLGYTPAQAVLVARHRHAEWSRDPAMAKYLRPATLLGQEKFPGYVEAAEGAARRPVAARMTPEQRAAEEAEAREQVRREIAADAEILARRRAERAVGAT